MKDEKDEIETSEAYFVGDPVKLREKRERKAIQLRADHIATFHEKHWREKVKLEKPDVQEDIWARLCVIREARRLALKR